MDTDWPSLQPIVRRRGIKLRLSTSSTELNVTSHHLLDPGQASLSIQRPNGAEDFQKALFTFPLFQGLS